MDDLDFTSPAHEALYDPNVARICFESIGRPDDVSGGQTFFAEGQNSDRLYFLTQGEVRLVRGKRTLDIIKAGEIFGEMAAITGEPRTAAAVAKGDCRALSLDADQFERALVQTPEFALMLMSILINRLRLTIAILAGTGKLAGNSAIDASRVFDQSLLDELSAGLKRQPQAFPRQRAIMKEGDKGGFMYVVVKGSVAMSIKSKIVERVGRGGTFGEMTLVDRSPRAASAVAETDSELLSINRVDFLTLVKTKPAFAISLLRSLSLRLGQMTALQS